MNWFRFPSSTFIYVQEKRLGYMGRNIDKALTFIKKAARTVNITDKFCKDVKFTIGKKKQSKENLPKKNQPKGNIFRRL